MSIFNTGKSLHTVRASSVLTSSYVAGTVFSMDIQNFLGIELIYTKGDETSCEVKLETSTDGGTTYQQQIVETPASSGEIALALGYRKMTATGTYSVVVSPIKADMVKISAKATGGTPTGTLAIKAITSWV